jgi:predicted transcriptional regulator
MKKTLYSLMLSDDVVREIDQLAHQQGTNRSALVNQILAEYVDMTTPESSIGEIFRQIGEILDSDRALVPCVTPNAMTMSMKSSLQYRYRPTVKYSVELYRDRRDAWGELSVVIRTQSESLRRAMSDFFHLWKRVEDDLIAPYLPIYTVYSSRFTRTIAMLENRSYSTAEIASAISAYVRLYDRLMKGYLGGSMPIAQVRKEYVQYLQDGNIII